MLVNDVVVKKPCLLLKPSGIDMTFRFHGGESNLVVIGHFLIVILRMSAFEFFQGQTCANQPNSEGRKRAERGTDFAGKKLGMDGQPKG